MPDKPSYEELQKQIAELQAERQRRPFHHAASDASATLPGNALQSHSEDLAFLYTTSAEFLDLQTGQNIYRLIGDRLREIVGPAIVIVSSYQKETGLFRAEYVKGVSRHAEAIMHLLKKDPVGMTVTMDGDEAMRVLQTGKMAKGPEGIYELSFGAIPRSICRTIEKWLNIGTIFVVGFVYRGDLLGDMVIITRRGANEAMVASRRQLIDTFSHQAAVALQRARFEQALKESEEKYKELVQHAPAGICEMDMAALKFTSVNDVMSEYLDYSQKEFLDLNPVSIMSAESEQTFHALIENVFANQPQELSAEFKIKGKHQREFWVMANTRFFYDNGRPKRAMAVVHDITEIRRAEEERRKLEAQLQNARKLESLGTLAGGVAHDLNNILSGIVSYPDLLLMDLEADSPLRDPLLAIKQSGEKAAEIVQDLLTMARRSVVTKKCVSLNRVVTDFIASPEYRKIVGKRADFRLEMDLADDLLGIAGSGLHLFKTVMNLVANGTDAMPAGGKLMIGTRNCYIDQPYTGFETVPEGEYAVLEVTDQGIGMPPSDLEKIFDPFYTKKALGRSGTGLGMSVVWGTLKDHDGFIDIVTAEGSGTTFALYFPASRLEIETPASVRIDDYLGKGESVLIVDDVGEQRDLARRMLDRLGYEVHTAPSGEEALAYIRNQSCDIVVLDMVMPPGMDGLDTFRKIREIVPEQKAVIASGYAATKRVQKAREMGAGDYIKKPFTLEKIGLAVRNTLDRIA